MTSVFWLLAQSSEVSGKELKQGWGSLIFVGCFFLALIIAFIWWISRR
jgi:uncharacterized membrane protein AbrB (regulator of aidB expression)